MKPVPTPRGTRPAPIDCVESRVATARFCTSTVAGRTFSATPATSGPVICAVVAADAVVPAEAVVVGAVGVGRGVDCGIIAVESQAVSGSSTVSDIEHIRVVQRRGVIADAPPCPGPSGASFGAL